MLNMKIAKMGIVVFSLNVFLTIVSFILDAISFRGFYLDKITLVCISLSGIISLVSDIFVISIVYRYKTGNFK